MPGFQLLSSIVRSSRPIRDSIERTSDSQSAPLNDVGIDHRSLDILVAEKVLNGTDVIASFEQVGGEAVAKRVACDAFQNPGQLGSIPHSLLKRARAHVMTPHPGGTWISG